MLNRAFRDWNAGRREPAVLDRGLRNRAVVHWQADEYGYLVASPYVTVTRNPGYIEILPVDPAYIYVPVYDPLVVFARSVRGVVVTAITWGPTVFIGTWFAPFGWAKAGFIWPSHVLPVAGQPWHREWITRYSYVHPYTWVRPVEPRVERHEIRKETGARHRR